MGDCPPPPQLRPRMTKKQVLGESSSCKWLVSSRLDDLLQSKFPLDTRIEFIRSKLPNFSAHISGVTEASDAPRPANGRWMYHTPVSKYRV